MKRLFLIAVVYISLTLVACTATTATPTPPVERLEQKQPEFVVVPPTPTPIPFPSPTPSLTPLLLIPAPELTITPAISPQSTPQTEVLVAALNIRAGPGVDYPIIGLARAGDVFDVTGVNTVGDWLQVVTGNDYLGWVSGQTAYTRLPAPNLNNVPVVQDPPPLSSSSTTAVEHRSTSNGKLIFTTGSGGGLYRVNADGSDLRYLTGGVIDPVVSHDGRQVAFTRWDGAEIGALYTINVDGSGERAIVGDILQPKSPTWSPDGQQIVLSFQHGGLRDPEEQCNQFTLGRRFRIPSRATITKFRVNRDGSVELCFIRFEDLLWRLRKVEIQTGAFEDLPSDEYSYNPAWDPQNLWRVISA
jgi:uncharacterized protein YgiM (DUF1202 family)